MMEIAGNTLLLAISSFLIIINISQSVKNSTDVCWMERTLI